jgi:hypothetical protein
MDEIPKKQVKEDALTTETKESKPAEAARLEPAGDVVWAILTLVSANKMNREKAGSILRDWVENERELSYEGGMLYGYAVARDFAKLGKGKQQDKAMAKLARGLAKLAKGTPEQEKMAEITKGLVKLAKRKLGQTSALQQAKTQIERVLMKKPKAMTDEDICDALKKLRIEVPPSKDMPEGVVSWPKVRTKPYYKNLFSFGRRQVARARRIRTWREKIEEITMGAGLKMADFFDKD